MGEEHEHLSERRLIVTVLVNFIGAAFMMYRGQAGWPSDREPAGWRDWESVGWLAYMSGVSTPAFV
jgi:hypothetical protein